MKILETNNLNKTFKTYTGFFEAGHRSVTALKDVSISLEEGRCAAIIGESGSGKTTLGRVICRLTEPDSGSVIIDGKNSSDHTPLEFSEKIQMIFQDPFASLDPKLSIGTMLGEAVSSGGETGKVEKIETMLETVGLPRSIKNDYPHQFSGGQRQRIAIARALLKNPKIIIADEPLSALDISIQNQLLRLFIKLKEEQKISFVLISHDINTAALLADEFFVMHNGEIVEKGVPNDIISSPREAYTKRLIAAIP